MADGRLVSTFAGTSLRNPADRLPKRGLFFFPVSLRPRALFSVSLRSWFPCARNFKPWPPKFITIPARRIAHANAKRQDYVEAWNRSDRLSGLVRNCPRTMDKGEQRPECQ